MAITERHVSPDGLLTLVVAREDDGDLFVGLEGFEWHTHGDLLVFDYGGTPESAVRSFVDEVVSSERWPIVTVHVEGKIRDAWISSPPLDENDWHAEAGETVFIRKWDGEAYK